MTESKFNADMINYLQVRAALGTGIYLLQTLQNVAGLVPVPYLSQAASAIAQVLTIVQVRIALFDVLSN